MDRRASDADLDARFGPAESLGQVGQLSGPPIRFVLHDFGSIRLSDAPRYLVEGLIPREGLTVLYGPPKSGKSFLIFDLMMRVALGWKFRDRAVERGLVVYLALEGQTGFSARVEAFRQHQLAEDIDPAAIPFRLVDMPLKLATDAAQLVEDIRAQIAGEPVAAVVIDTLNRAFVGSESDDREMNRFVEAADHIRRAFTCAVIIVHHSGLAGDRPRGHTSLGGAADALLAVKKSEGGLITLTSERQKDGPEGEAETSRLESVEVGADRDGRLITSCIVLPTDEPAPAKAMTRRKLSDRHVIALNALDEAVIAHGAKAPPGFQLPGSINVVPVERWRDELHARGAIEATDANPRQTFKRLREALIARQLIGERQGFIWNAARL